MGTELELSGERVRRLGIWMAKCGGADGKQSCLNLGDVHFLSGLKFLREEGGDLKGFWVILGLKRGKQKLYIMYDYEACSRRVAIQLTYILCNESPSLRGLVIM